MLRPGEAFYISLKRYHDFSGRSRRSEYWWTLIYATLIMAAVGFLDLYMVPAEYPEDFYTGRYSYLESWYYDFKVFPFLNLSTFILLLPITMVGIRRMHDVGRSGWWIGAPTAFFYTESPSNDLFLPSTQLARK